MWLFRKSENRPPSMMPPWVQLGVVLLIVYLIYGDYSARQARLEEHEDSKFDNDVAYVLITSVEEDSITIEAASRGGAMAEYELEHGESIRLPDGTEIRYD